MKLLQRLAAVAQRMHLAASTVECYSRWVAEFLMFHKEAAGRWRHPRELGAAEMEAFLTYLTHIKGDAKTRIFDWPHPRSHADVKTTMIYTHVMNKPAIAVTSPLDRIALS